MSTLDVEGFTAEDPIPNEEWDDQVGYWLREQQYVRRQGHNRNGWFAQLAGSEACIALGHKPDENGEWDGAEHEHPRGWDGDSLCEETRYGVACTECESDDCSWEPADPAILWDRVRAGGTQ